MLKTKEQRITFVVMIIWIVITLIGIWAMSDPTKAVRGFIGGIILAVSMCIVAVYLTRKIVEWINNGSK